MGITVNGQGEPGSASLQPSLPSKRDVLLVVLVFFLLILGSGVLRSFVYRLFDRGLSQSALDFRWRSTELAWYLQLVDRRVALVVPVLLYLRVARTGNARDRRERRGEIFTGVVNLHIAVVAAGMALFSLPWDLVSPELVGADLLGSIAGTAFWCLVGFHLCEGRYLLPMGGILILNLVSAVCPGLGWARSDQVYAFSVVVGPVVGLAWQAGSVVRVGSGFDLFPTGLWPALRRCGRPFLMGAACFCCLSIIPMVLSGGRRSAFGLAGIEITLGPVPDIAIAYVASLFLVRRDSTVTGRSGPRLTYRMAAAVYGLLILFAMLASLVPGSAVRSYLWYMGRRLDFLVSSILFPLWAIVVPMSIYRWWSRGLFVRPLAVAMAGIPVLVLAARFLEGEQGITLGSLLGYRFLTIVLAAVFLLHWNLPADEPLE